MDTSKPSVLIVHGAFHPPACYDPLTRELEAAGFEVVVPRHPSLGKGIFDVTLDDDIAALRRVAEPLFAAGKKVILVPHSYGGFLATNAAKDHTTTERKARGLSGGFAGIVYLAAAIVKRGETTAAVSNPQVAEGLDFELRGETVRLPSKLYTIDTKD